jgi:hypothetical protein
MSRSTVKSGLGKTRNPCVARAIPTVTPGSVSPWLCFGLLCGVPTARNFMTKFPSGAERFLCCALRLLAVPAGQPLPWANSKTER